MRRGVTIFELALLVSFLAFLGWVIVPLVAMSRESTRKTSCTSNLEQLSRAVLMYAQDHGDTLPGGAGMGPEGAWGPAWWAVLKPYVRDTRLFVCPSHVDPPLAYDTSWPISYGCNPNFMGWQIGASLSQVVLPTGTIMLGEKNLGDWAVYPSDTDPDGPLGPFRVDLRHEGGANYAFLDGRVKWLKAGADVNPTNLWINN